MPGSPTKTVTGIGCPKVEVFASFGPAGNCASKILFDSGLGLNKA